MVPIVSNKLVGGAAKTALNVAIVAGTAFGLYKLVTNLNKNRKENKTHDDVANPSVQLAMKIRSAVNPSGIDWMVDIDTTREAELFAIASQITDLEAVRTAYSNLYSEELNTRLRKELSSRDFDNLMLTISRRNIAAFSYAKGDTLVAIRNGIKLYKEGWLQEAMSLNEDETVGEVESQLHVTQKDGSKRKGYLVKYDPNPWNPFSSKERLRVYEDDVLKKA